MANTPKPGKPPSAPVFPLHQLPSRERSSTVPYDPKTHDQPRRRRDETQSFELNEGRSTDRFEIPIEIQVPASAATTIKYDLFPVIPIPRGETIATLGEKITCAFVILQGQAIEFIPTGRSELQPGKPLGPGNLIWISFFDDALEEPLSSAEVVAETDLLMYQITHRELETNDASLRRKRERYIRTLILRESEAAREQVSGDLELSRAKTRELNALLRSDLKERVHKLVATRIRPLEGENEALKQRTAEIEPWLETCFEYLPRIFKDREVDIESMMQSIERIFEERFELYDAIRGDLLELLMACQEIDPIKSAPLNAAILKLMAKLDEAFKRNMPRKLKPEEKL